MINDDITTNNMLESFNRTWNSLSGKSPSVWKIQELFVKQEADSHRSFVNNARGNDLNTNTGRKQQSLTSKARIKFIVDSFETISSKEYLQTLAIEFN